MTALFSRYPELQQHLRYQSLGHFPTPLSPLPGLVSSDIELWVKREDLAGTLYGGNKVRKLEFLLPGATSVLTFGGYGSHHVLATALYGRSLGCRVRALVYPQPNTPYARATCLAQAAAGAELIPSRGYLDLPYLYIRSRYGNVEKGEERQVIAPGGSSPLGTLGWVSGGLELAAQIQAGVCPRFDRVYVALGSGGTAAGLALGLGIGLGSKAPVVMAVRVVPLLVGNRLVLSRLLAHTRALLPKERGRAADVRVVGGFVGQGYGHETAAGLDAVSRAKDVGLTLEPTYTGKTLAALLAHAQAGQLRGQKVLFLNTYGGPVALTDVPLVQSLPPLLQVFTREQTRALPRGIDQRD